MNISRKHYRGINLSDNKFYLTEMSNKKYNQGREQTSPLYLENTYKPPHDAIDNPTIARNSLNLSLVVPSPSFFCKNAGFHKYNASANTTGKTPPIIVVVGIHFSNFSAAPLASLILASSFAILSKYFCFSMA